MGIVHAGKNAKQSNRAWIRLRVKCGWVAGDVSAELAFLEWKEEHITNQTFFFFLFS